MMPATRERLDFDYDALKKEFKTHCTDYAEELTMEGKSAAVEFCNRVIYEVGPESRKVKKGHGDKTWKFNFIVKKDQQVEEKHVVFISTYKQENAEYKPYSTAYEMVLTLKQAALIAHETLGRLVKFGFEHRQVILFTPQADACFSKYDMEALAIELDVDVATLVISINQSTQEGGHYLNYSDVNIAICAAEFANRNIKDEDLKKNIVARIVKPYIVQNKMPDKRKIEIIAKYATGGIPAEFAYEELIKIFDGSQKRSRELKLAKAQKQATQKELVELPDMSTGMIVPKATKTDEEGSSK